MSALSVQPTFPIFTDIDGQPLDNGYIWIGIANTAPIGNPINVYWDAALTIVAAQPIRTIGGYPANNGTPARLYVNSDYSIQVQNKNGSVLYSAPAATERISGDVITGLIEYTPGPDSLFTAATVQEALDNVSDRVEGSSVVGYMPGGVSGTAQAGAGNTITLASGASAVNDAYKDMVVQITSGVGAGQYRTITGYVGSTKVATVSPAWGVTPDNTSVYNLAVPRTAQSKMREVVSVLDFGADPTGVADSTTAIQSAIDSAENVYFPTGNYKVSSNIKKVSNSKLRLFGDGFTSKIFCEDCGTLPNFSPGFGGNATVFYYDIAELEVKNLRFVSNAAVTYAETTAIGNFFFVDQVNTAYDKKIIFDGCYFEKAKNDAIYSGSFGGSGNDVYIDIVNCSFFNSGRYDVTVQNCQKLNVNNNTSKDSGAFFDVEPNGASDVARLVVITNNNIQNAQYNCIQVSIADAANRGACVISSNVMSMNTTFVASVALMQPITVRTDYACISNNSMYVGKARRLIDVISTKEVTITGNTMYASVNDSSAEIIRLTNSFARLANNYLVINGASNYITLSGTSNYTSLDTATQISVGGAFENAFNILGSNYSLDTRAFLNMGNMRIDSIGTTGSEVVRLRARKSNNIALSYNNSGALSAPNLPTSSVGLAAGSIWNDGGTLKIV